MADREQARRDADTEHLDDDELVAHLRRELEQAEARLAKVPALVEALREVVGASDRHYFERLQEIASEALAAFEEPGGTS